MVVKLCANLSFMFQEEAVLLKRYTLAAGCGFRAVECANPYEHSVEEVTAAKKAANVEQILINTPVREGPGKFGLAAVAGKENEFLEDVNLAVKYAEALDCKFIHVMSGAFENRSEKNCEIYFKNLSAAAGLLKQKGITALIEPINNYSVPNYFMNSYELAMSMVSKMDNLKIMMDIFHLQQLNGNLTRNIRNLLPSTGHVQIAQVPDRHEPDSVGEIDYKYILSVLDKEYNGWIGLEYKPASNTKEGLKWVQSMGYGL